MSAGKISNVRSAMMQSFVNAALFAAGKVQYENIPFDASAQADAWAAVWFVPNQPNVATLGPAGEDNVDGFLQIDVNYPQASGQKDAEAKVEAVRNVFPSGSRHLYQGDVAVIRSCGRSQGRVVNGFYRINVTVNFYSRINRS